MNKADFWFPVSMFIILLITIAAMAASIAMIVAYENIIEVIIGIIILLFSFSANVFVAVVIYILTSED